MQKLRRLVVVAGLSAPMLGAQAPQDPWPPPGVLTLPSQGVVPPVLLERTTPTYTRAGEPPPSTWPDLFPGVTETPANDADWWVEAKASAAGVTIRVPHPKAWEVAGGNRSDRLIAIRSPDGIHFVDVSEPRTLPAPLPLPFPVAQLDQATQSLSKVIGTHDFRPVGGGQARAGDRWWLWQDQMLPTSAASRLPPEVRDVLSAEFDSLRLWIFVTSVDAKLVTVFCWALVRRGLAPADLEKELRSATAVFDRMIKRMVLQKEPGTQSPRGTTSERQRASHANGAQLGYALFTGAKLRE